MALALVLGTLLAAGCAGCGPKDGSGKMPGDLKPVTVDGAADGQKFNLGKVEYTKETSYTVTDEFDVGLKGKVVDASVTGAEVLFEADFDDGDPTAGDTAMMKSADEVGVHNGKLYIPYSGDSTKPFADSGWTTWAPDAPCLGEDYVQGQLSFDGEFHSGDKAPWMSAMIGIFKGNPGAIADNPGDGIFIAFNTVSSAMTVYSGKSGEWAWPAGNVTVGIDSALITGDTHVDVVATEDRSVFVYVKGTLVLKMEIEGEKYIVYDADGKRKGTCGADADSLDGAYFSIFTHLGGVAIDEMKVLGCTKGRKHANVTIKAEPTEGNTLGLDITNRKDVVSICYTLWFNAIHGNGTNEIKEARNVSEYTEKYGFSTEKGFGEKGGPNAVGAFHYWAKPAQGYYRSTDKAAAKRNMELLYKAGVDFVIIDYTYATSPGYDPGSSSWNTYIEGPSTALLDSIMEMRAEGEGTPYVVFWMGSDNMFGHMKEKFLDVEKWKDCFVYWDGKPFIMNWEKKEGKTYDGLTVRSMYGLAGKAYEGQWSYLEIDNSRTVANDAAGNPEHMCADVATQETYMSLPTAHGRQGGRFWNQQWKNVFDVHPKIMTVTWWNEWCAQLFNVDGVGYVFTDNFNQEYSRDVEPMEGGHGDLYYRWLCEYIKCYKNGLACPELTE